MTHLCRISFDILGDLVKVSSQAMEDFFQIVLPRRFGQLPSMVRSLAVIDAWSMTTKHCWLGNVHRAPLGRGGPGGGAGDAEWSIMARADKQVFNG